MSRPARRPVAATSAVVMLVVAVIAVVSLLHWSQPLRFSPPDACVISALGHNVDITPEQATNAATIAAIGARRGMPSHAVTVALAAALQESKLRNLPAGDRDSIGLFQQRPSQGWGRPEQIRDPRYAASRFYARLSQIPGWHTMPVAEAAQRVQRSADGSAYAVWEPQARSMAEALTGHAGAAVSCTYRHLAGNPRTLQDEVLGDFGVPVLNGPIPSTTRGWAVAGWLVTHAGQHRLAQVSYLGHTWVASTGRWKSSGPVETRVRFVTARPPAG